MTKEKFNKKKWKQNNNTFISLFKVIYFTTIIIVMTITCKFGPSQEYNKILLPSYAEQKQGGKLETRILYAAVCDHIIGSSFTTKFLLLSFHGDK